MICQIKLDSFRLLRSPTGAWTGTGGASYDVYVIVDLDGNGSPDNGEPAIKATVTINGNTTITKTLADFTVWPIP
jgi:hypothetical protein